MIIFAGMTKGSVKINDASYLTLNTTGLTAFRQDEDGTVTVSYCCMVNTKSRGKATTTLDLPSTAPFILLRVGVQAKHPRMAIGPPVEFVLFTVAQYI
jgi:hypothetical protein